MSNIDEIKVKKFADTVFAAVQQDKARLIGSVMRKDENAEMVQFMRLNASGSMDALTVRHGDTQNEEPDFTARWAVMNYFAKSHWYDTQDKAEAAISDLTGPLVANLKMLAGRKVDDVLIAAMDGSALEGKGATSTISFDTANQEVIANVGGAGVDVGMNREKIVNAKQIMDKAEVPETDRWMALGAIQISDLLNDSQFTSADYRTIKALESGDVAGTPLLGFNVIRSERLLKVAANRHVLCWHRDGVGISFVESAFSRVSERADKNYLTQVYLRMGLGSVRVEDQRVVRILSKE